MFSNEVYAVILAVFGTICAIWFWALFSTYRLLHWVRPEHREIQPLLVWVNLVPVAALVWWPVTVLRMARSVGEEYESNGVPMTVPPQSAADQGLAAYALVLATPFLGVTFILAVLFLIAYGFEVNSHRKKLAALHDGPPPWWDDGAE